MRCSRRDGTARGSGILNRSMRVVARLGPCNARRKGSGWSVSVRGCQSRRRRWRRRRLDRRERGDMTAITSISARLQAAPRQQLAELVDLSGLLAAWCDRAEPPCEARFASRQPCRHCRLNFAPHVVGLVHMRFPGPTANCCCPHSRAAMAEPWGNITVILEDGPPPTCSAIPSPGRVVAPDGSSRPDNPTKRRPFGRGGKVALPAALTDTYTSAAEPNTDADGER